MSHAKNPSIAKIARYATCAEISWQRKRKRIVVLEGMVDFLIQPEPAILERSASSASGIDSGIGGRSLAVEATDVGALQ